MASPPDDVTYVARFRLPPGVDPWDLAMLLDRALSSVGGASAPDSTVWTLDGLASDVLDHDAGLAGPTFDEAGEIIDLIDAERRAQS